MILMGTKTAGEQAIKEIGQRKFVTHLDMISLTQFQDSELAASV
jgi:hypothetical protein